MSELPAVTGKEAIAAFSKVGFYVDRISKSSHHILKKDGHRYLLSVSVHGKKTLKRDTLRNLIKAADISVERFIELLDD
ncbi:MAG: type II toxin-antitoxin system HicA family toxin [Planctomycetes bacterium]|nr:type II toxin-antitoxin system HicA family toxin [Planctomycetota bacterium]